MSETTPEAPARPPAGGSFLTRKYGPLPGWGWIVLGAAGAGGYYLWRRAHPAAPAPAATTADATSTDTAPDIAAVQSEVQQLQGAASTDIARDTTEASKETKTAAQETKTAAQLAAEEKKDTSERKQLDTAQRRIATLRRQEARERPRRRPPAKKRRSKR
jgi:hypothetical protein